MRRLGKLGMKALGLQAAGASGFKGLGFKGLEFRVWLDSRVWRLMVHDVRCSVQGGVFVPGVNPKHSPERKPQIPQRPNSMPQAVKLLRSPRNPEIPIPLN